MGALPVTLPDPGLHAGEVVAQAQAILAHAATPTTTDSKADEIQRSGLIGRIQHFFVGIKPAILKEERVHVHWLSIAYMVVMSVFALQVFALQDLQTALSANAQPSDRAQSSMLVFVIVIAVIISDYAAPHARELAKLVALRGEIGLAWVLNIYAVCVYGTDGYAVVTVLYRSVAHLPATTPPPSIGPLTGAWTEVSIRGLLIVLTGWMIHTVTQKQYPTSNTLARRGAELMGGVLLGRLANQRAAHVSTSVVAEWFRAFTEAAKRHQRFRWPWARPPFFNDAAASEQQQWDKLLLVIKKVEEHPVTPHPQRLRLPAANTEAFEELIAGVMAALLVRFPQQPITPMRIARAVQALGYDSPDEATILGVMTRLQSDQEPQAEQRPMSPVDPESPSWGSQENGRNRLVVTMPADQNSGDEQGVIIANSSTSSAANGTARGAPKPGTKKFQKTMRDIVLEMQRQGLERSFFVVARRMSQELKTSITPEAIKATMQDLLDQRLARLTPGATPEPDPVLDDPALDPYR